MRTRYILALILAAPFFVAQADDEPGSFYEQRERGWFWHEVIPDETDDDEEDDEEVIEAPPVLPEPSEDDGFIELDAQWLRDNMEDIKFRAINNPTDENIAAYAYAQRLMFDMSTRFADRMVEFTQMETELSEELRRPTTNMARSAFDNEQHQSVLDAMQQIDEGGHLWFFYSSTCPYCAEQVPVLKALERRFGLDILAISLDGYYLPGTEQWETVADVDGRTAALFDVQVTPTIVLVNEADVAAESEFMVLAQGLETLPRLKDKILLSARDIGLISQEQYALTSDVRDVTVMAPGESTIRARRERIESDPGYLSELLRERLQDNQPVGATSITQPRR